MNMTEAKKDIEKLDDVKLLVNHFYDQVRQDDLLADIFNNTIQDRWQEHLEKMYRFWQTVLLDEQTYMGSPFVPHAYMPLYQEHFDRWQTLFSATVDQFFDGENADKAKQQGQRMAVIFLSKISYLRENP